MMTAGLEGDVKRCPARGLARRAERVHLGMRAAESLVMTDPDRVARLHHDGADQRIGLDRASAALGFGEGTKHPEGIVLGHVAAPGARTGPTGRALALAKGESVQ
jgi:hypothetical protein